MTDTGLSHANGAAPAKTMTPTSQPAPASAPAPIDSLSPFNNSSNTPTTSTSASASTSTSSTSASASASPSTPNLSTVIAQCHHRVHSFLEESHPENSLLAAVQRQTRASLSVVASALTRYNCLSELSLSYNGGKDCLVLLILFLAGLHPHPSPEDGGLVSIPSIYALPPDPFPAVEDFVRWSSRAYHLDIVKYTTHPPHATLRSSFQDYLDRNPSIKAIFVGTRRTDPHGAKLTHFDRTDSGWPDFVRVHPVIDWHYAEIWAFIRHLDLKYCPLYDQGYTSLGGTGDTHPNPMLRVELPSEDDPQGDQYRPAYELTEDLEERLGRQ
ncbi:adenine nucleotide alpha hydrolases-like protein [Aspergillus steynii IBT 23096]|uniref:FAD synthase n=1 Tax=Aspergillus steynii IBT 23096 TaxID=1392250 RepID=A0A2I2FV89_9EURO|nr:adenine nucleotide alpha hydrolases-like protein [Aspergillus steynii IBT 23096]PLB44486.1 adenine nucleotide alpha hydrolases-like protein [Aspergillus steynii IBT 23096]